MKTNAAICLMLLLTGGGLTCPTAWSSTCEGGTIVFQNLSSTCGLRAPVTDEVGRGLEGDAFCAQLYAGLEWTDLHAVGSPVPFRTNGFFFGGPVCIPFIPAGVAGYFQVRVWATADGETWEAAQANGGIVSESNTLLARTGGDTVPPSPPPYLCGLQSFVAALSPTTYLERGVPTAFDAFVPSGGANDTQCGVSVGDRDWRGIALTMMESDSFELSLWTTNSTFPSVLEVFQRRELIPGVGAPIMCATNVHGNDTTLQFDYVGSPRGVLMAVSDLNKQGGPVRIVALARGKQTIEFALPPDAVFGDPPLNLVASASSGLPVTFSVLAGPASIEGTNLNLLGAGSVVVQAAQAGDEVYVAAESAHRTVVVARRSVELELTDLVHTYDGSVKSAGVKTVPANVPTVVSYMQNNTTIAAPVGAGSYDVIATVEDPANYWGVASGTLEITRAPQEIAFEPLPNRLASAPPFSLVAATTSGLPLTFRVTLGPALLEGNQITLIGPGKVTIAVTQNGNENWLPAQQVSSSFISIDPVFRLIRPVFAEGPIFHCQVSGTPGIDYALDVSTHLLNWSPISTNRADEQGICPLSSTATSPLGSYYRARWIP